MLAKGAPDKAKGYKQVWPTLMVKIMFAFPQNNPHKIHQPHLSLQIDISQSLMKMDSVNITYPMNKRWQNPFYERKLAEQTLRVWHGWVIS